MSQNYLIDEIDKTTTSPSTDIDKLTNAHDANRSNFSGASDPATAVPYQIYADTANDVYKQRDPDDTAWNIIASASGKPVEAKTGDYTTLLSDYNGLIVVDATSGPVTITLPSATTADNGWRVTIKKTDSSANAVIVASTDLIDGLSSASIVNQNIAMGFRTDGATYFVDKNDPSQNAAPGNLVMLQRFVVSSQANQEINSLITSTYDNYVARFYLSFSTAGETLQLDASDDNGATFIGGTAYKFAYRTINSGGTEGKETGGTESAWTILTDVSSTTDDVTAGEVNFTGLLSTVSNKIIRSETNHLDNTGDFVNFVGGGQLESLLAINSVRFAPSAGTMIGTIDFFGVKL